MSSIEQEEQSCPVPKTAEENHRQWMIERVRRVWIQGIREQPLYPISRLDQALESSPSVFFDDIRQGLLIIGATGAGKTTLRLELARNLLERAEKEPAFPIPVIFNLSSWAARRWPLTEWLIDELNQNYDVPRTLGETWVKNDQVLPLLDGLDEVVPEHRAGCVEAINDYQREHRSVPLAVCCQVTVYEALAVKLQLPGVLTLQSLSRQQIDGYLAQGGESLTGLRTALADDETLGEFLDTPLLLTMAASAYQGASADAVRAIGTTPEDRRQHLLATYVEKGFERLDRARPPQASAYSPQRTKEWLAWLAAAMQRHHQTEFHLGRMQPDWLTSPMERGLFRAGVGVFSCLIGGFLSMLSIMLGGLLFGILLGGLKVVMSDGRLSRTLFELLHLGLMGGTLGGLFSGLIVSITSPLLGGLLGGLLIGWATGSDKSLCWPVCGLLCWMGVKLVGYSKRIRPVEMLRQCWRAANRPEWFGLRVGLAVALLGYIYVVYDAVTSDPMQGDPMCSPHPPKDLNDWLLLLIGGFFYGMSLGSFSGLVFGLGYGLLGGFSEGEIASRISPNEEIKRSAKRAFVGWMIGTGVVGPMSVFLGALLGFGHMVDLGIASLIGLSYGLIAGLYLGGLAVIQHYTLRLILWLKGYAPLRYVRFLEQTTDLTFLRKVGGGYLFAHKILQDYFASLYRPPKVE